MVVLMGKLAISEESRKVALERLHKYVDDNYLGRYGVVDVRTKIKGRYIYIDWVEGLTDEDIEIVKNENPGVSMETIEFHRRNNSRPSKLCRIRSSGDMEFWTLELYKYSDWCYDVEGDLPFGGGTIEECFEAAAGVYIKQPI
jgi:hypothetical protein